MINSFFKILVVIGIVINIACTPDAPHDNPLDPAVNFESLRKTIRGQVLQKNAPHFPLPDCLVIIKPGQEYTYSDANGLFTFSLTQSGMHSITCSKDGYDSLRISVNADSLGDDIFRIYLNGKPIVASVKLYSEYIDQWWPDPVAFLNAEMIADDPDGMSDLSEIYLTIGADSSKYNFTATARPDSFSLRIDQLALPEQNIVSLVGEKIYIHLRDSSGSHILNGPHQLVRVLNDSPLPVSPTALETTVSRPTFYWQSYFTAFSFTFEISVFHISAGIPVRIFHRRSLAPELTQFAFPDSLTSGTYFWTVGVRDRFDDLIRSKEASFIVP
ncbi:MAG: carboxypeptidase regulatory-like domain-containing protein [Calditrichaeota bacterium]|nr:carboxypeptidase regulatory-like domain-containing protein [Calditrichota bacterium]